MERRETSETGRSDRGEGRGEERGEGRGEGRAERRAERRGTRRGTGVDRSLYPFESRFLEIDGRRMHYVDEGDGPTVVLVHGTPTWSFVYRHLIENLATSYRVIALDHLGFGLSDKPQNADYRPQALAQNLEDFIERLGLEDIALVVHDFGGPIGLSYAIERPDNVRALVIFNSWMWSLAGAPAERMSRLMSGRMGRLLYTRLNFSPRALIPMLFADKSKLTKEIHRHYTERFPSPAERMAPWTFARALIGSSDWYEGLWNRRERITDKPALLLWGMRDTAFKPDALARWKAAFPGAGAIEFPEAGHFPQEEAPEEVVRAVRGFLSEVEPEPES